MLEGQADNVILKKIIKILKVETLKNNIFLIYQKYCIIYKDLRYKADAFGHADPKVRKRFKCDSKDNDLIQAKVTTFDFDL